MFNLFDWVRNSVKEACWAGVNDFRTGLARNPEDEAAFRALETFAQTKALPAPKKEAKSKP